MIQISGFISGFTLLHLVFSPHKNINCKFHDVLEICNLLIMMTEFYSECCALVAIQHGNVGGGMGECEGQKERKIIFILERLTGKGCHWTQTVWHDVSNCVKN